ncbi:MAG TPA: long-chain fatty acid--CoA ligase [Oscillatoriaceae cyanobacterium]
MAPSACLSPYENLIAMLAAVSAAAPEKPMLRAYREGAWRDIRYGEAFARVQAIAGGLAALGVQPGDRIAILSNNRPEWALADFGSLAAGAVVVTIYPTLTADETAYILKDSGARVVFVEDAAQLAKVQAGALPELSHAVVFEGPGTADGFALTLAELEARDVSGANRLEATRTSATHATPFSIVYTSGTTGTPKGAVLTHGNVLETIAAVCKAAEDLIDNFHLNLSLLPLSHVLERFGGHFLPIHQGGTIAYARSMNTLGEDFAAVRPQFMMVVPRVLEKAYARVMEQVAKLPRGKRKVFDWALKVGQAYVEAQEFHRPIHFDLALKHTLAERLVFKQLRARFGGRLDAMISGGAPLAPDVARFFWAIGMPVYEGWGLTETTAPATVNLPGAFRFGTVGRPLPGVELRIAEDGEICVKGPDVFTGYFGLPAETAEAFEDGYFKTGDIGEVDADGFLRITDRKKELIVTANGKKVPPQKVEALIKARPYIAHAIVMGDRRSYLVALLTIDREALAQSHPALADFSVDSPEIQALAAEAVADANAQLARFEQIKRYTVLEGDFTPENGQLTITLKPKRRVIEARHREAIAAMYSEESP